MGGLIGNRRSKPIGRHDTRVCIARCVSHGRHTALKVISCDIVLSKISALA